MTASSCKGSGVFGKRLGGTALLLLNCLSALCCAGAHGLEPGKSLNEVLRQVWSTENGLPQNAVHSILQTRDGFLWLGTEGGLARFDGYQFRLFDRENTPGLAGDEIRCMLEDGTGALWLGTASGLTRLSAGVAHTFGASDGVPAGAVRSMMETSDGRLWVLTDGGLSSARVEGAQAGRIGFVGLPGDGSGQVLSMAKDDAGAVWLGTTDGLYRAQGQRLQNGPAALAGKRVDLVATDAAGQRLMLDTSLGVMELSHGVLRTLVGAESLGPGGVRQLLPAASGDWVIGRDSVIVAGPTGTKRFVVGRDLPGTQITTAFEDRAGAVWIGTNGGVARVWRGEVERTSVRSDADSAAVLSIGEDREGDVWIGTETAGVEEFRPRLFMPVRGASATSDTATTSVVQARDGTLWAGTNGAGVEQISPQGARSFTSKDGLTSDIVLAVAAGSGEASDVWVGTPDGLDYFHDNRWSALTSSDGLADDLVRSLLVARDGAVWVGSRRGVTRWKDGHATILTKAQGLGSDLVGPMLQDADGDFWIGTSRGLSRVHGDSVRNYTVADGLPGDVITALAPAHDGGLWVAAEAHGLARWAGPRFVRIGAKTLPQQIFAIVEDNFGSLWLRSDHGIVRVRVADLERARGPDEGISVVTYGAGDGLTGTETGVAGYPSMWKLKDERIAIATRRGIVVADAAAASAGLSPPPVVIEDVSVDGRSSAADALGSLPPDASHFAFAFAGIDLAAPQHVQYRYMLRGLDKNWVDAGTRRTAYYTNIPHGQYVFRVSARVAGGGWSSPAEMPLSIRPHLYETAWFRVLIAVLVVLLGFAIYRLRVRSLQSRFAAVSAERNRLAREIHDTLAQSFVAVSVRLEVMSQMLRGAQGVEACREQLNETRALVRDSLAEARRSIWDLRADGAASQSLPSRLLKLIQEVRTQIPGAQLETSGTYRPLAGATEDELFRIAQETANNAVRHASANSLKMRLNYALESVSLEVSDDGRGFDTASVPSRAEGHFGLTGIRERARILNADVMLDSEPGRGTCVRVTVPLTRERMRSGEEV